MPGTYDIFLALHPFRDSTREFRILTRPLADLDARYLAGAEGFYLHTIDLGLIALRFHRRVVDDLGPRLVRSLVARSGLPMIVLDDLPPDQRRAFLFRYLSGCTTYVQQYLTDTEAMPIVERLVLVLAGHVTSMKLAPTVRQFNVERELPIVTTPAPRRRPPRRLGTAS